jgi:hypothetical protein
MKRLKRKVEVEEKAEEEGGGGGGFGIFLQKNSLSGDERLFF